MSDSLIEGKQAAASYWWVCDIDLCGQSPKDICRFGERFIKDHKAWEISRAVKHFAFMQFASHPPYHYVCKLIILKFISFFHTCSMYIYAFPILQSMFAPSVKRKLWYISVKMPSWGLQTPFAQILITPHIYEILLTRQYPVVELEMSLWSVPSHPFFPTICSCSGCALH